MRFAFIELLSILLALSAGLAESRTVTHIEAGQRIRLGQGYYAETDELKGPCITGDSLFVNDMDAFIGFENALTRDQLNEDITARFSGGINVFIASAKVTNKLSSLVNEDAYKRKFIYKSSFKTKTEKLANPKPDTLGQRLIELRDSNLSIANCGREFVESIKHGGELYIVLEFDFANKEILNEISTTIEFQFLGIKKVKEFSKKTSKHKSAIRVSIDAFQIGGDPAILQKLLSAHPSSSCRLDALNQCDLLIEKLIQYATAETGFMAQLKDSSPLSFTTAPYVERSLSNLVATTSPLLTSEQLFAYQELASWYNREDKRLRKIDQLLGSPLVGRTQRNQLYFARDAIDANVSQTLKALTTCEATSSLCLQQRDQVAAQLQSMDESLLTPWRSFFYYCRKNDPDSAAGIQAVLQTLNLTDCQAAEDALSGIKDLKLRNLGLVDIEFLRSMTALQNLDISRNQISNLYALSPLRQLKTLKANRNILDSVAGLEQLKNLQHLELARNNLKTLEPVFGLGSVKFLSAYNNLLNPEELSGKFPGAKTLYSSDDACRHETSRLLAAQRIDLESAQLYLEIGFGPSYLPGGQIEWVDCEVAAETFE
jgi:hypothetical protein